MKFASFLEKKSEESKKQLEIIRDVLVEGEFEISDFTKERDPYIFCKSNKQDLDFEGIRIYKIGSSIAYRIQNESQTEPYGKAYSLNVEKAFENLISDMNEEKAAERIKKLIIQELNSFFEESQKAQEKINAGNLDAQSQLITRNSVIDISNTTWA